MEYLGFSVARDGVKTIRKRKKKKYDAIDFLKVSAQVYIFSEVLLDNLLHSSHRLL